MAKTLMYVSGSPTSVKLGDTDTNLYLQVAKDNVAVDLTTVKSITVKIADANNNYLKDISITPANLTSGNSGILTVPLNSDNVGGLNSGDYYFEVWIVTADSETEIYPDMNVTRFHVFNNLVGGTTVLTTLTMQAFLDKITSSQANANTALINANTALTNANTALNNADTANANAAKALSDLNAGNYLTKDTLSSAPSFEDLQTQVANSAVGTNLLLGTSGVLKTYSGSGWGSGNLSSTNISLVSGQTYVARMWIEGYDVPTQLVIRTYSSSGTQLAYVSGNVIAANSSGYSIVTWTADSNWTNNLIATLAFTTPQSAVHSGQYKELKLEKGSVATDYNLNVSDILTKADYAKIQAAIVALGGSLS